MLVLFPGCSLPLFCQLISCKKAVFGVSTLLSVGLRRVIGMNWNNVGLGERKQFWE